MSTDGDALAGHHVPQVTGPQRDLAHGTKGAPTRHTLLRRERHDNVHHFCRLANDEGVGQQGDVVLENPSQ